MEDDVVKAVQSYGIVVDKKELLRALGYDRGQYDKGYEDGLNADKWIPCSERLPSFSPYKYRKVLVTLEDDNGQRLVTTAKYNEKFKEWYEFTSSRFFEYKVIAWMIKPEPYKE